MVLITTRCPKCGKNNYGEMEKCSFCGAPLKFNPEEEIPEINEEDIKEKMSQIKAKRLRNPITIGVGGGIMFIGVGVAIILYLLMMFFIFSSGSVQPEYTTAYHFDVPGGDEYIFGEITAVDIVSGPETHGYYNHTAYEIDGDGKTDVDWMNAIKEDVMRKETDTWVFSERDLGEVGDNVLVKVESRSNYYGEKRAVDAGEYWWGGKGYMGGWIFAMPGILIFLTGLGILIYGLIGKKDTSIDRLLEEDAELRKQQLALLQSARAQAMEKQKRSTFHGYSAAQSGSEQQQPQPSQQQGAAGTRTYQQQTTPSQSGQSGEVIPQVETPTTPDQPLSSQTVTPSNQPTTPGVSHQSSEGQ